MLLFVNDPNSRHDSLCIACTFVQSGYPENQSKYLKKVKSKSYGDSDKDLNIDEDNFQPKPSTSKDNNGSWIQGNWSKKKEKRSQNREDSEWETSDDDLADYQNTGKKNVLYDLILHILHCCKLQRHRPKSCRP